MIQLHGQTSHLTPQELLEKYFRLLPGHQGMPM